MDRTQRILTSTLWGVLVLAMLSIVATGLWAKWRQDQANAAGLHALSLAPAWESYEAPTFALTDHQGRSVSSQDLRGQPYVATFIFTHCAGTCPMMTQKMAALQTAVPEPTVKLVSFTCDPERDTPEVLKQYAERFGADGSRWHFLTGTVEQMRAVAAGMKVAAAKAADGSDQYIHSEKFFLIDGAGQVVGMYSSNDEQELKQLAQDASALARAPGGMGEAAAQ